MYKISNQMPQVLDCLYSPDPMADDFDPVSDFNHVVTDQLLVPVNPGTSVGIQDNSGTRLGRDEVGDVLMAAMIPYRDDSVEQPASELLSRMMLNYDVKNKYPVHRLFANQAAVTEQMDLPDAQTIYSAKIDVIPEAANLLRNNDESARRRFFAALTFTYELDTTGFAFRTDVDFDAFKEFFKAYVAALAPLAPTNELATLGRQFDTLTLKGKLTESLTLRKNAADGNEAYAFARVLPAALLEFSTKNPDRAFVMPFTCNQYFCPEHIVLVNVDAHAHARAYEVNDDWSEIATAISTPVRIVSKKHLSKLTAVTAISKKMASQAANSITNSQSTIGRYQSVSIPKRAPSKTDIMRRIRKLLDKMGFANRSQNIYKVQHRTYARPSRRDPDNYNLAGKTTTTRFKPDIHLYVDTSGSISESDYEDAVKICIHIARKLNVNLYFTSFSHVLSEDSLILAKGRTAKQMWTQIQKIDKVTGGTDYEQIWRYVDASKKRRDELSVIITDFEYNPPNRRVHHGENIYYIPCAYNWEYMRTSIEYFVKSMVHIDPAIRRHILV